MLSKENVAPEVVIRRSHSLGCWCILCGSHEVPIRQGLYSTTVAADIVARDIKTMALGPVTVVVRLS